MHLSEAAKAGFCSVLGWPILRDHQVLAVLMFYSDEIEVNHDRLIDEMASLSDPLGALFQAPISKAG